MSSHDAEPVESNLFRFSNDPDRPQIGSVWRHYKGELYVIEGYCMFEPTDAICILYKSVNNRDTPAPWARPYSEWNTITSGNVRRFTRVAEKYT
jgi:hypothetical protein